MVCTRLEKQQNSRMPSWGPQEIKRDKVPRGSGAPRNSKSHMLLCVILKPKLTFSYCIIQLGYVDKGKCKHKCKMILFKMIMALLV